MGINNVTLTGHLGNNCQVKSTANGGTVGLLNLAVDDNYINKDGEKVERTYWIRCVSFQPKFVESLEKYATKGRLIGIEGKLTSRSYLDKNDDKKFVTEIIIDKISYLTSQNKNDKPKNDPDPKQEDNSEPMEEEEIPF